MNARAVTVYTADEGFVRIPEPSWCTGKFHGQHGARVDITHTSDDVEFPVESGEGLVPVLRACFTARPFATDEAERLVHASVELDGEWFPVDPRLLDGMADALVGHAAQLRHLARRLTVLQEASR